MRRGDGESLPRQSLDARLKRTWLLPRRVVRRLTPVCPPECKRAMIFSSKIWFNKKLLLVAFYQLTYQHDSKDFNICNYKY